jgi:hypothetical protein
MHVRLVAIACGFVLTLCRVSFAVESVEELARTIDHRIDAFCPQDQQTELVSESAFIRRVTLDLAGRVPTLQELRQFRESESLNKRAELVRRLIESADFAYHHRNELDMLLLRRLEHNDAWRSYLLEATRENRPWDQIFREIMLPEEVGDTRPAMFIGKRIRDLDKLTNDCSVIWFGVNVGCAKCHDHPLVFDWEQSHYYGMASFFKRTYRTKSGLLGERHEGRIKYQTTSGEEHESDFMYLTGTKVDEPELDWDSEQAEAFEEAVKKSEKDEQADPPKPQFRPRSKLVDIALSEQDSNFFARNIANRIWARMFGRGLVHPLDQMHSENPASHPELLTLLANDLRRHNYDLRRLLHAIALTDTYARSEAMGTPPSPDLFASAVPRPLSPHQLSLSYRIATSNPDEMTGLASDDWAKRREDLEKQSESVARRLEIPDEGFQVPVSEALWFSNNAQVQNDYLSDRGDRLVGYLASIPADEDTVLAATRSVLSRDPLPDEQAAMLRYLTDKSDQRNQAIRQIVWALLSSPEFRFNH